MIVLFQHDAASASAADAGRPLRLPAKCKGWSDAEPHGLSHALAEGTLIEPIQALTEKYPKVRVRLSSALTSDLINRLLAGELDVAAVLLPEGKPRLHRF